MQYFQNFDNLVEEIKINNFRYVKHPLKLISICRNLLLQRILTHTGENMVCQIKNYKCIIKVEIGIN